MKNLIKTDLIQAKILKEGQSLSFLKLIFLFLKSKTCRIHTYIRLRKGNKLISFIAKKALSSYFIEIGAGTQIGKYFFLPHPRCIIIANDVVIGEHVHIGQYVTLGGNNKRTKILRDGRLLKFPIIGDRVSINPGAVVGGPVQVGNDVVIGANSVVTRDVLSNSIIYGQNQVSSKKIEVSKEGGLYITLKEEKF